MYKKLKTLVGVIILGAIGSGFWEVFLKDLLFFIGNLFVKYTSLIYKGYVDSVYEKVGVGSDFFQVLPSVLISTLIFFFPFLAVQAMYFGFRKIDLQLIEKCETVTKKSKIRILFDFLSIKRYRLYVFIFLITLPSTIIYLDLFVKEFSTYMACKVIERNIEIVRPYITEKDYFILNSNYKQIDNKEKLITILVKLNNIKQKNNIKVEKNNLLGIDLK